MLMPWRRETLNLESVRYCDMEAMLNDWIQCGDETLGAKAAYVHRCTYGMTTSAKNKTLFRAYRGQNSDCLAVPSSANNNADNNNNEGAGGGDPDVIDIIEDVEAADGYGYGNR